MSQFVPLSDTSVGLTIEQGTEGSIAGDFRMGQTTVGPVGRGPKGITGGSSAGGSVVGSINRYSCEMVLFVYPSIKTEIVQFVGLVTVP